MSEECLSEEFILLRFAQVLRCPDCMVRSRALSLRNVPVFDDHGCIMGIDTEVRYMQCEHLVDGAEADPVAIAEMMNEVAT